MAINIDELHPIIKRLLEKRGFKTKEEIQNFFSWDLKDIPSLISFKDLDKAVTRIIQAIDHHEKIGIYGDYDVDGTTSCAVFYHFFKILNKEVFLYQPSRFKEGYGVHNSSIDKALEDGVSLLITVDCGITNTETAEYTHDKNIDLIITDHHKDAAPYIPKAFAVINPNRRDEDSSPLLKSLAGVGVAFCICMKLREKLIERGDTVESIYPLLQFVAIGTLCDLAHLNLLNLKLVRHGLKQIPTTNYRGIGIFFTPEEKESGKILSERISFLVGPMINSKGRLDHPEAALKLLISKDHEEAFEYFSRLEISNRERKFIQSEVFNEAKKLVLTDIKSDEHLVSIVYSPNWHEGVIGIVASKLVETFRTPAIVFTNSEEEGVIKASARTAGALNLFNELNKSQDLFLKFGGHKAAAGLSMRKENFEIFKKRMEDSLREIPEIERKVQSTYDLNISLSEIDTKLVREIEELEPFGMGNESPVFRSTDVLLDSYQILKDVHVKWYFYSKKEPSKKLSGISFFHIGKWDTISPDEILRRQEKEGIFVDFTLSINRFRGNEIIQLMVSNVGLGHF